MSELDGVARLARLLGPAARRDAPLGALTTYRVGGPARLFVSVRSDEELGAVASAVSAHPVPTLVLGRGSNLVVADGGFDGLVVSLGGTFDAVDLEAGEPSTVRAGGAASLPVLARRTAAAGLGGLEWAVGVPGSVGGAVRMNAGGHGAETSEVLTRAGVTDLKDGRAVEMPVGDLGYSYRRSSIEATQVVRWGEFRVERSDPAESLRLISEIVAWRRENQPGGQNAGSIFTNPPGDSAGRLVEAAGLKGLRVGSAQVSSKHANFIQADPGGSGDDVILLVEQVRGLIAQRLGVTLELEVKVVGRPSKSQRQAGVQG